MTDLHTHDRTWHKRFLGGTYRRRIAVCALSLAILGAVGYWHYIRHNFKRFQEVQPGVLYRMGQPSRYGLNRVIETYDVRTIVCLRYNTPVMKTGYFFDLGKPSGPAEDACAAQSGVKFLHWRLGGESHWPWPDPWFLERFWELMDDPANYPVLLHCRAGQHRTGTLAAIYRLEYDRWEVERVLEEMYSFGFGVPRVIQEHNLRTYVPRPWPPSEQLEEVLATFNAVLVGGSATDFETLLRQLRTQREQPDVESELEDYLANSRPFCLGLAQRLVESSDDPLALPACNLAVQCLSQSQASATDWASSAALIADFGSPDQQESLLELLKAEPKHSPPTRRYEAVVSGVTNRYTQNRIPYLRPLLDDPRHRPKRTAQQYRYADTAVARLTSIDGGDFLGVGQDASHALWDEAIRRVRAWFAEHPDEAIPGPFCPPEKPWWADE